MNNKKEGEYYSQMVRRYKNEYGGKNLQEFCIKEKVSYTKMLHCLRNESYRKPQHQSDVQLENPGLMPLVVDSPLQDNSSVTAESKVKPYKQKFPKFADMQSDEKTISALTAQAHNAEADKRTLQRKLAASERRVQDLEKRLTEQQAASE